MNELNLHNYNLVIINSSSGKDSLSSIYEIYMMAEKQSYDKSQIVVSHQDLGEAEWGGTVELAKHQADLFGLKTYYSQRQDKTGYKESMLEYVERRKKWPSPKQRYCTSDFKRGPGARIVTMLTRNIPEARVLYVFGFRKEESPSRSKKKPLQLNERLTTRRRLVHEYLPVHTWSFAKVWDVIRGNKLPYHPAYDLGMPRLSCCFCFYSPFDALVIAGRHNPELLQRYVEIEEKIEHTFKDGFAIKQVLDAINSDYQPEKIADWVM